jgi:hypothetical protein
MFTLFPGSGQDIRQPVVIRIVAGKDNTVHDMNSMNISNAGMGCDDKKILIR